MSHTYQDLSATLTKTFADKRKAKEDAIRLASSLYANLRSALGSDTPSNALRIAPPGHQIGQTVSRPIPACVDFLEVPGRTVLGFNVVFEIGAADDEMGQIMFKLALEPRGQGQFDVRIGNRNSKFTVDAGKAGSESPLVEELLDATARFAQSGHPE